MPPLDQISYGSGLVSPTVNSIAQAAAGAAGPGLPQPNIAALSLPGFGPSPSAPIAQAGGIPVPAQGPQPNDPLQGVMDHINQGETGNDPNAYAALYGGGHFGFPQWSGREGPAGITHAAGKGQWEPATWDSAVKFWMSRNPGQPAPDFKNPADQDKVQRLWAIKTYDVDKNGRTLSQAATAGDVDYNRLAGQWPSLGHPGGAGGYQAEKADIRAQETEINKKIGALSDKIGALDARDPESLRELRHYREEMEKYQQQALQLATNPPKLNPGQQMQQQGGMALIIGMLGGLLTKRPLIASLNAGAAALNAYNKGDQEAYQREIDKWKVSTDAMFKMAEFEHQMYRDTLADEKLSEGEKLDKLKAQAQLLGDQRMILATQGQSLDAAQNHADSMAIRLAQFDLYRQKLEGGGAGAGKSGEYDVTTPDGKTKRMSLEQGKQPGSWFSASTGQRMQFPEGTDIQPITAGAGRQEATQINAMVGSTNEAVGDLKNLMELPSTATAGWFMGVQTERPSDLAEAIRRSFAGTLTDREAKDLLVSAQGIQREIATIEAQGRATGLVGLTNMADTLIPQVGDPGPVVLRKYAQIRQIIERNIETIINRSNVDQKQKALLERNLEEIRKDVPFTVHDINELEKRLDSGDDVSVAEYAKRAFADAGMSAVPKAGDVKEFRGINYRFKGGDPADPNSWEKQ